MQAPPSFYEGDTLEVAKNYSGKTCSYCRRNKAKRNHCRVEAYKGPDDKAAHSYGGRRTDAHRSYVWCTRACLRIFNLRYVSLL